MQLVFIYNYSFFLFFILNLSIIEGNCKMMIKDLYNFPFETIEELEENNISIAVTESFAVEWLSVTWVTFSYIPAYKKIYMSFLLHLQLYIITLGYVIFICFSKNQNWINIIYFILGWVFYNLIPPKNKGIHQFLVFINITLSILSFFYSPQLFPTMLAISSYTLIKYRFTQSCVDTLIKFALENEDVFCSLWSEDLLSICFPNGYVYNTRGSISHLLEAVPNIKKFKSEKYEYLNKITNS